MKLLDGEKEKGTVSAVRITKKIVHVYIVVISM